MIHPMLIYMVFVFGVLISVVLTKCCYLWNRYTDAAYLNWQKNLIMDSGIMIMLFIIYVLFGTIAMLVMD